MRTILKTLLVFFLISPANAALAYTIAVFGDSLTAGYQLPANEAFPAVLEQKLKKDGYDVSVVNLSVSGETTAGGKARIPQLLAVKPDMVIVELGANDALRGLPVKNAKENLAAIIKAAQKEKARVVLAGMRSPPNYGPEYVNQFEGMYRELAKEYHVPLFPFILNAIVMKPEFNLADGYHPNAAGVVKMVEDFYPFFVSVQKRN